MSKYVVRRKVIQSGRNKKTLYYPVPVSMGRIDSEKLAEDISRRCTLTPADVLASLKALSESLFEYLERGYHVQLKDIGLFSVSVSGEGCEKREDVTARKVYANKICFRADTGLKKRLKHIRYAPAEVVKRVNTESKSGNQDQDETV